MQRKYEMRSQSSVKTQALYNQYSNDGTIKKVSETASILQRKLGNRINDNSQKKRIPSCWDSDSDEGENASPSKKKGNLFNYN